MGSLPKELPFFSIPDVPFTLETLGIILPYAVMLAIIGLLESLLTASVLDDMTHTESNKQRSTWARYCKHCCWFLRRNGRMCNDWTICY